MFFDKTSFSKVFVALASALLLILPITVTQANEPDAQLLAVSDSRSLTVGEPLRPISSMIVKYKAGVPMEQSGMVTGQSVVSEDVELENPRADAGGVTVIDLGESVNLAQAEEIAEALQSDPGIEWAEPNGWAYLTTYPSTPPNDTSYGELWGLWGDYGVRVGAGSTAMTPAWTTSQGEGAVIAALDSGQIVHPDLGGVSVTNKALASNVATLTTGTPHGFTTGDSVIVFGVSGSESPVNVSFKELTPNVATITTSAAHGLAVGNAVTIAGVDSAVDIATRSRINGVASITTTTNHGLVAGSVVTIADVTDTSFNGTFSVATAPTTTSFTYANAGDNVTSGASVGTVASTIFNGTHTVTAVPSTTEFRYTSIAGTVARIASGGTSTRSIFDGTHTITETSTTTFTFSVTSGNIGSTAATGAVYGATGGANTLPGYDFVSGGLPATGNCGGSNTTLLRAGSLSVANSNRDGDVMNTGVYGAVGRDAIPLDPGDWGRSYFCLPGDPTVQFQFKPSTWHGTHVAGTIAAVTNNAAGVSGTAPNAKLLPVRVATYGGGLQSDIAAAIRWAAGETVDGVPNPNPADVINMSVGGVGACPLVYQQAIDAARASGSIVVASSGNDNINMANFTPANCRGVISVAATKDTGERASFSNFGSDVTIAAPGFDIFSTLSSLTTGPGFPGGETGYADAVGNTVVPTPAYGDMSGTSMAAPHVSGVIALMGSSSDGPANETEMLALLRSTAQPFIDDEICDPVSPEKTCGAGIVNAASITAPQLSGISPTSGSLSGGSSAVITGTNLTGVTAVQFGDSTASFTVVSATQITATIPSRSAGSVTVTVRSISGRSNRLTFTYGDPAPPAPEPVPTPPTTSPTTPLPNPDPFPVTPTQSNPVDVVLGLSPTQMQQLSATELAQLPPQAFAVMTRAQVRALRPNQITPQISRASIRAMSPEAVRAFQPRTLTAFTPWQIREFTRQQAAQLRPTQIASLGPVKRRIIAGKRT
jgi:subtilisin family serine protease